MGIFGENNSVKEAHLMYVALYCVLHTETCTTNAIHYFSLIKGLKRHKILIPQNITRAYLPAFQKRNEVPMKTEMHNREKGRIYYTKYDTPD